MRNLKLINPQNLRSDAANLMKNVMNSFPSKKGTLTDFPEGLHALALTFNGHEALNILLLRTHAQMVDSWACELKKPKFSDANNIDDYCIAMQEHISLELSCNRKNNHIKQIRMCLNNLDDPIFNEVKNSLLQEIRGKFNLDTCARPKLRLYMLHATIQKHHSHVKPAIPTSTDMHRNNNISSLSINDDDALEDADGHDSLFFAVLIEIVMIH